LSPYDFPRIEAQIAASWQPLGNLWATSWQYVAMSDAASLDRDSPARAAARNRNRKIEMAQSTSRVPTQAYRAFAGAGTPKRGLDASKLRYSGANLAAT
jgi:hypothetical protein